MKNHKIVVLEQGANTRLDDYLVKYLNISSKSQLKKRVLKVLETNKILKLGSKVHHGQELTVIQRDLPKPDNQPALNKIKIIYEDQYIIVISKQPGQIVYPPIGNLPTISRFLETIIKDTSIFEAPDRAGIVHRLDKDTHGLLVCAKTPQAEFFLKREFKNRQVKKIYHTILSGPIYQAEGILDFPLGPAVNPKKRLVREDGKPALTQYKILKRNGEMSLAEVCLHTGRTHQIRVHFSHIKHPILGDRLYSRNIKHNQLFLCSKELSFHHPFSKQWVEFKIDYPAYFKELLEQFH